MGRPTNNDGEAPKPVNQKQFWHDRLFTAVATGRDLHTIVYDIDYETWCEINRKTKQIMSDVLKQFKSPRVLDVGCGYGSLYEQLKGWTNVDYVGVDLSPDLLEIACIRNPKAKSRFIEADANDLPFESDSFDLAVFRSMRQMIEDNLGNASWHRLQKEVFRVAKSLLIIEYEDLDNYQLIRRMP